MSVTSQTSSKLDNMWQLLGLYLDSCNCDWGCPCQFNARPTHGSCEGLFGIHIKDGIYGNVKLDGLNLVWIGWYPGAIHEGHGKASLYIDDRASDNQFDALSKIIKGEAKGSAFDVYSATLDHFEGPKRAKIIFQFDGIRSEVKAEGICEVKLEPIKNPVTGKDHRVIVEFPSGGFESSKMDMASSKILVANDGYFDFRYESTYGSVQEISWTGTGP